MVTKAQYDKALARAMTEGLRVVGSEIIDNQIIVKVNNPKNGEGHYTVRFAKGQNVATCNCQAGMEATYCKHRAFARQYVKATGMAFSRPTAPEVVAASNAAFDALQSRLDAIMAGKLAGEL